MQHSGGGWIFIASRKKIGKIKENIFSSPMLEDIKRTYLHNNNLTYTFLWQRRKNHGRKRKQGQRQTGRKEKTPTVA